jgi:hypothetical protein
MFFRSKKKKKKKKKEKKKKTDFSLYLAKVEFALLRQHELVQNVFTLFSRQFVHSSSGLSQLQPPLGLWIPLGNFLLQLIAQIAQTSLFLQNALLLQLVSDKDCILQNTVGSKHHHTTRPLQKQLGIIISLCSIPFSDRWRCAPARDADSFPRRRRPRSRAPPSPAPDRETRRSEAPAQTRASCSTQSATPLPKNKRRRRKNQISNNKQMKEDLAPDAAAAGRA